MADKFILGFVVVLAGIYFYATSQIPTLEIGDPLGPKAFPQLLGIGLIISGVMLLIEIIKAGKYPEARPRLTRKDIAHYWIVGAVAGWTLLYFLVFEKLGYMIATTIYLLALTTYFNKKRTVTNVLTSVLFCVISYVMFTQLLGVTLARGPLPF